MEASTGQRPLVLLVEDDAAARELVADFLEQSGYRVIGAKDGADGWRLAQETRADVMLVDHDLPLMTGTDLTRRLKGDARTGNLPVVLMTAHVEKRLLDVAARAGCDGFVRKPFSLDQLRHELERVLREVARARPQPLPQVLIVDDDREVRQALRSLLESSGYAVEEAGDGAAAMSLLKSSPRVPSLILLDLILPVMDGWQFLALQQKDALLAKVPVVVLTAVRPENAGTLPARMVLEKPIDNRRLIEALDQSLSDGAAVSAAR